MEHRTTNYFNGMPCKVCGLTQRYASNKRCVACNQTIVAAQNARRREESTVDYDSIRLYQRVLSMRWTA